MTDDLETKLEDMREANAAGVGPLKNAYDDGFNALLPVVLELAEALEIFSDCPKNYDLEGGFSYNNYEMSAWDFAKQALKNLAARLEK